MKYEINVKHTTNLPDDGTLEDDEHEQGKQTVVPVFIKTPKRDTEDLEDEEGGRRVLGKERGEGWDGDVVLILAIEVDERSHSRRRKGRWVEE